jgi:SAM-dependent methyltransferase
VRSKFADKFNHDEDAAGYDLDVLNEQDPIRAGYERLLDWMVARAVPNGETRVLDLGAGTGNLGIRLPAFKELVCVDISRKMIALGEKKLAGRDNVRWIVSDLLEYFDRQPETFDIVLSSYSIHHLTPQEKDHLFERIRSALVPGGKALLGDLMFENAKARKNLLTQYRESGRGELAREIEDEFFWDQETALASLRGLGFDLDVKQFSELSWGLSARKPN